ncbi:hypothetical protein [Synechococcus sp. 1G10]|uniref:hypothetical protein n=1 Tax=Synechococcus sp. 1G10 TaxID=2025605 RepID=UPI00117EB34A|nr:hypothetical protein [Synechococcus sp. 1G10]
MAWREASGTHWRKRHRFGLSTFMLTAVNHSLASAVPNHNSDDLPFIGMAESLLRELVQFLDQGLHGSHVGSGVKKDDALLTA